MLKQLRNVANFIGTLSYGVLFVTFVFQVALRFIFNKPLSWSDELIVILYVFSMFWAGAFMLKEKDHVMLDIVYELLGEQGKRVSCIAYSLVIGGLFVWAIPASFSYVKFMMRESTPVLGIPYAYVFGAFILFLISIGLYYVKKLTILFGSGWRREVGLVPHEPKNSESVE